MFRAMGLNGKKAGIGHRCFNVGRSLKAKQEGWGGNIFGISSRAEFR